MIYVLICIKNSFYYAKIIYKSTIFHKMKDFDSKFKLLRKVLFFIVLNFDKSHVEIA